MSKLLNKKILLVLTVVLLTLVVGCSSDGDLIGNEDEYDLTVGVATEEVAGESIESITDQIEADRAEITVINTDDSSDVHRDESPVEDDEVAFEISGLINQDSYEIEVDIYEEDEASGEEFKIYQGSDEILIDGEDTTATIDAKLTDAEAVVFSLENTPELPDEVDTVFIEFIPRNHEIKEEIIFDEADGEAVFEDLAANQYNFNFLFRDEAGEDIDLEDDEKDSWEINNNEFYAYPGDRTTEVKLDFNEGSLDIDIGWELPPEVPETIDTVSDGEVVELSWDDISDSYFLYRGQSEDELSPLQQNTISENEYTDDDVEAGESYYYSLRAYDEDGLASSESKVVNVVVETSEPEINVSPVEGEYPGNREVSVEINAADESSVEFEGNEVEDSFILADYLDEGETGTLEITASNEEGNVSKSLDYTREIRDDFDGVRIYHRSDSAPNIWVWEDNGGVAITEDMGYEWTGPEMEEAEDDGWYVFEIPTEGEDDDGEETEFLTGEDLNVVFDGGEEMQIEPETAWYDGEWHDDNPDKTMEPSIDITPAGGEMRGEANISVESTGYEVSESSIELDGSEISTEESFAFELEDYLADGESATLSVSATNANGTTTEEADFTRNDDAELDFSWDNATVYFAITDRFKDGNPDNNDAYGRPQEDADGHDVGTFHGGDLAGLTEKLNEGYFEDLGVDAIWISAAYEQVHGWVPGGSDGDFAHYAYHGYYALDYTEVDQSFGTVEEMREFVDTAHDQGVRVVMDIVMNHPGYHTINDMDKFDFGELDGIDGDWTPNDGDWDATDYMTGDEQDWANWWGSDWTEAQISEDEEMPGYDTLSEDLFGLPLFKTEMNHTDAVDIPPLLENKWQDSNDDYVLPAAQDLRQDLDAAPAEYITKWLAAWVEEFGIDGFRVDTASHVPLERWDTLQEESNEALEEWRDNNPDRPSSDWDDDFWMTAEVWGHGVSTDSPYFDNGFESVINFTFQGQDGGGPAENDPAEMEDTYANYASNINNNPGVNFLSYISQHDTHLHERDDLIDGGTNLLLVPGAAKIFYGDEIAREEGPGLSDGAQGTRSSIDWNNKDQEVLEHFQKLGQFRNRNVAVGAGEHEQISSSPYTFSRVYNEDGFDNRVVVAIADGNTEVEVSDVFADGTEVRNAYADETATVEDGTVSFTGENGVILIERD